MSVHVSNAYREIKTETIWFILVFSKSKYLGIDLTKTGVRIPMRQYIKC